MSFSGEVKEEISKLSNLANKEAVKYELLGYIITNNISAEKNKIKFCTESEYSINRFSKLLNNLQYSNHKIEIIGKKFCISVNKPDISEITYMNNTVMLEGIINKVSNQEILEKAFVRGSFLGGGSVNNPKNNYHLEIIFSSEENASIILEILSKYEINFKKIEKKNGKVKIDTSKIEKFEIPPELMHKMRSSVILAGALLGRYKKAIFSYPGGCDIGSRPIDLHLKSFEKLGIEVNQNHGNIECKAEKIKGEKIDLDFPSVGATENAILASVLASGTTTITNAAREPEIIDLQNFLNKMGAKIEGAGTDKIQIEGVKTLKDISYNIMPDRIEAGSFLCFTAATKGNVILENVNPTHITPIINKLEEAECKIEINRNKIKIFR